MMKKTPHLRTMSLFGLLWAVTFVIWLVLYFPNRDQPLILLGVVVPIVLLAIALKAAIEHMRITAPPKPEPEDQQE